MGKEALEIDGTVFDEGEKSAFPAASPAVVALWEHGSDWFTDVLCITRLVFLVCLLMCIRATRK